MSWAQNGHFFAIIILKSTLFAEIAVLESEEVEHTVDADGVDALLGICHNAGLCMECYAQTCFTQHWLVVGSVAYGNGLSQIYLLHLGFEVEQCGLAGSVYYLANVASGELAVVVYLQLIGIDVVDAVLALQEFAEISESTAEDGYLVAATLEHSHQTVYTLCDRHVDGYVFKHA